MKGQGSGKSVNSYRSDFFITGTTAYNYLKIHEKYQNREYSVTLSSKNTNGILPGSYKNGYFLEAGFKRTLGIIKIGSEITYDAFNSSLMSGTPVSGCIMKSILTTPPTFDNANGLSSKDAYRNANSYQINPNMQRSYAPGIINNPYWLLKNIQDKESYRIANFSFDTDLKIGELLHHFSKSGIQYQTNKTTLNFPENMVGILHPFNTNRMDKLNSYFVSTGFLLNYYRAYLRVNSQLSYNFKYSVRSLNREDFFPENDSSYNFKNNPDYRKHEFIWMTNLNLFNWILGKFTDNLTRSDLYQNKYLHAPSFSAALDLASLIKYRRTLNFLKLRGYSGISYSDLPIAFSYGYCDLQNFNSAFLQNARFNNETIINFSLQPEKTTRRGAGIDIGLFRSPLSFTIDVYENEIQQGVFPVLEANQPVLKNLADYKIKGLDADLSFSTYSYYSHFNADFKLVFSTYRSEVTNIRDNLSEVPLAGFSDIYTALIKGQPKGVLVGTAYLRNAKGEMIIGNDGFPLVDNTLHIIGNPNPDFILGFETSCSLKPFSINILAEFRKGGDIWNGTENALSYFGLAKKTIEGRKTFDYIFPGVKPDGTVNSKAVDFANPENPFESNRWYRYGPSGVAEDGIQDGSWFRIKEITIEYTFTRNEISYSFSLFTQNPILLTRYKGVDPASSLWGKANTSGLDLFNFPQIKSYGASIKVSL